MSLLPFTESATAIVLWLRAFLMIGDAYRLGRLRTRAAAAIRSYHKHGDRRRAEARAYNAKNREKRREYQRAYRAANLERHMHYEREWRAKNADRYLDTRLRRMYGLTLDEYTRLLERQGGGCGICGKRSGRGKGGSVRLHVDHDHATGQARGLLCGTCNRGIGQLGDDLRRVRAAVRYLNRSHATHDVRGPLLDLLTEARADLPQLDPRIEAITREVLGRDVTITTEMLLNAERIRQSLTAEVVH